jgi:hypothetical protein
VADGIIHPFAKAKGEPGSIDPLKSLANHHKKALLKEGLFFVGG